MVPFGRHLLKARLRSRSENKDSTPGKEIHVWVCQEEKVVCGVRKRTTCSDVVKALLEDHRNVPESQRVLHGEPSEYCLLERWKGFERALLPLTRILPLWEAWGDEKPFIQFLLVKASQFAPQSSKKMSSYNGARAKSKQREQGPAEYMKSLPIARQKRMVNKAFRKLEKIRKERTPQEADSIDRLVQLIINQDHTIRQQIHQMNELDLEIEFIERRLWTVQDSAHLEWTDSHPSDLAESAASQPTGVRLLGYLYGSDGIDQLKKQVDKQLELIEKLSHDIDTELLKLLDKEGVPQAATASGRRHPEEAWEAAQLDMLRRDLEESMQRGAALHAQEAELQEDLRQSGLLLHARSSECESLASQLSHTCVEDDHEGPGTSAGCQGWPGKPGRNPAAVEGTDTDSDTGISSTHSQDSVSPCRKRPLPLGTA